jgi:hypothetical protein
MYNGVVNDLSIIYYGRWDVRYIHYNDDVNDDA